MAEVNTSSTLALTKKVYGENLETLKFEVGIGTELFPFKERARVGESYNFRVPLQMEHGFTYNGTGGAEKTLNAAIAGQAKQATVLAYETIGKARITTRNMHEAAAAGSTAFKEATEDLLMNLMASAEYREEHAIWYGQLALCKVSANNSGVLTITDDTWSAALVDGLEGAVLEAFDGLGASANQDNGDLTVTAVDLAAKTITVSGTSTNVDGSSYLFFKGARTTTAHNDMLGVMGLLTTVTGDVHGISTTTYSRWRPNVKSSFGAVEFSKFLTALSTITGRRVRKKVTNMVIPVPAFDRIASELQSSRRYDNAKKTAVAGFEAIEFFSSLGLTRIIPHGMLRDGHAAIFSENNGFRTGAKELGWETGPSGDKADIWIPVVDKNVYEARVSHIQSPAFLRPFETIGITGITYS